jgi:hypothetical protein
MLLQNPIDHLGEAIADLPVILADGLPMMRWWRIMGNTIGWSGRRVCN